MAFQNPQYLVETDWLQAHRNDATLRVLDCTVYLPNYFNASAAEKVEIVSGHAHWEQGHIPGSAFADLVQDLCDPQNTRFMFPMPLTAQFAAAMSRYGVERAPAWCSMTTCSTSGPRVSGGCYASSALRTRRC